SPSSTLFPYATLFRSWRDGPAELELVALNADGAFEQSIAVPAAWADTLYAAPGIAARVPLVLGVRNSGGEPARPQRLEISAPSRSEEHTSELQSRENL